MPLRPPPTRLLVGTAIMLIFVGIYIRFSSRTPIEPISTYPSHAPSWSGQPISRVPPLVKVTAESDRDHYYLGENPLIHLTVENRGRFPIQISAGSDYRGGTRANRFKITVRDPAGHLVADPMPVQLMMGGMGADRTLKLGEAFTISAPLMRYALIENPGTYAIEISHDLGWYPTTTQPIPKASISLHFSEPNEIQVQTIFTAASVNNGFPSVNSRGQSFGDYTCLRFPRYLPLLQSAAIGGNAKAVIAIGHIRGSTATESLLKLAANSESSSEVRLTAVAMLADRAPYPPSIAHHSPRLVISADYLRVDAWNDTLRTRTFRLAHDLLSNNSSDDSDFTPPALDLLSALGTPEDTPQILSILEANLIDTLPGGGVLHPQNQRIYKSIEALRSLRTKGWTLPASPTRQGEIYLTFHLVEREQLTVTPEIEQLALANLSNPSLIVRRSAYDTIRHPVPETHLSQVRSDFALDTLGLRDGVRSMIWRTHDLRLLPDLLARLENNRDRHQQSQLIHHALQLAGPRTVIPILISQLNQPDLARETLDELTRLTIAGRPSNFRQVRWTHSELDALQSAWREFYARHEERIVTDKKFSADDRRVPAILFGGRYDWSPRQPL